MQNTRKERIVPPNENLTRASLLKLTEDNEGWLYVCRWCGESCRILPESPNKRGQLYHRKTNTLIKNFLEMHYGKHMQELNPQYTKTVNNPSIRSFTSKGR